MLTIVGANLQATSTFIIFVSGIEHNTSAADTARSTATIVKQTQLIGADGNATPSGFNAGAAIYVRLVGTMAMCNGPGIYVSPIQFTTVYQAPTAIDFAGHPAIANVSQCLVVVQISSANVMTMHYPQVSAFSWDGANNRLTVAGATFVNTDIFGVVVRGADRYADAASNHLLAARTNRDPLMSDDSGTQLLGTPLVLTVNYQDVGSRIACFGFTAIKCGVTIDINLSTGLEFQVLECFSQAGVEEYSGIIETPFSNVIKIHPAHWEDDTDADKLIAVPFALDGITPWVQLQARVQVVGGAAAELDYVEYLRGWGGGIS